MCAAEEDSGDREAIELIELGLIVETLVNGESRYNLTGRGLTLVAVLVGQEAEASKCIDAVVDKLLSSPGARTARARLAPEPRTTACCHSYVHKTASTRERVVGRQQGHNGGWE